MATIEGSRGTVQILGGNIVEVGAWAIHAIDEDDAPFPEVDDRRESSAGWWTGHAECFWPDSGDGDLDILQTGMPIIVNVYPDGVPDGRVCYMGIAIVTQMLSLGCARGSVEASVCFAGHGGLIPATTA